MMTMDDQKFFHEATLRICGSLDIDVALRQCFLFLRETFPLDKMFLNIFDLDLGIVETIARADDSGGQVIFAKTILPEQARSFFAEVLTRAEKNPYIYTVAECGTTSPAFTSRRPWAFRTRARWSCFRNSLTRRSARSFSRTAPASHTLKIMSAFWSC
jgi:hypothetical protein